MLSGDLPRLFSLRRPNDLPQALKICLKLESVEFRTNYVYGNKTPQYNPPPVVVPRSKPQHQNFWQTIEYPHGFPPKPLYVQNNQKCFISIKNTLPNINFTSKNYPPNTQLNGNKVENKTNSQISQMGNQTFNHHRRSVHLIQDGQFLNRPKPNYNPIQWTNRCRKKPKTTKTCKIMNRR